MRPHTTMYASSHYCHTWRNACKPCRISAQIRVQQKSRRQQAQQRRERCAVALLTCSPVALRCSLALLSSCAFFILFMICAWSITIPVSIDMLQIHSYAQLGRSSPSPLSMIVAKKDQASHAPLFMWLFETRWSQKSKKSFKQNRKFPSPFPTQSTSRLSPEYPRLISSSLYSNSIEATN